MYLVPYSSSVVQKMRQPMWKRSDGFSFSSVLSCRSPAPCLANHCCLALLLSYTSESNGSRDRLECSLGVQNYPVTVGDLASSILTWNSDSRKRI